MFDGMPIVAPENRRGEAMLAALSLSTIMGDGPIVLTPAIAKRAAAIPGEIADSVTAFLRGKPGEGKTEGADQFDATTVFARLREPPEALRIPDRIDFSADDELVGPFLQAFTTLWSYLQESTPLRTRETILGPRDMAPNPLEAARFGALWRICEDPLIVLRDLARGCVPRRHVDVFSRAYPDLYAFTRDSVVRVIPELRAADDAWEPTYAQDRALQALLMTSTLNQRLIADIQKVHARAAAAEAAQPRRPGRANSASLEANETPMQRVTRK